MITRGLILHQKLAKGFWLILFLVAFFGFWIGGLEFLGGFLLLLEFSDLTQGIKESLLTSIQRMTLMTHLDVDTLFDRTGDKSVAT